MQEETQSQKNRTPWKSHHILLILVPGLIFLLLYPIHYRQELEKAGQEILKNPQTHPPDTMPGSCRIAAGTLTGYYTLGTTLLGAVILSLSQAAKRQGLRRALTALGLVMAANIVLCGLGLLFGHHVNRDLEKAIVRTRRTPMPERPALPAPQPPKP